MPPPTSLPTPAPGFHWQAESWGPLLVCDALSAVARHGFTSRQLGLRPGDGASQRWADAAASVGCVAAKIARVRQVHGAHVRIVTAETLADSVPDADAAITRTPGVGVAVVAADCVPILLADARTGAVGAVHAGWRGTAADAAGAAVAAMVRDFQGDPRTLVAAIGPSIGACCYAVGPELVTAFARAGHPRQRLDRWFSTTGDRLVLDLWTANRDLLMAAGLDGANVHVAGLCTQTHRNVFESFRADGDAAGRMAALVVAPS
jgi:YfiH family protein